MCCIQRQSLKLLFITFVLHTTVFGHATALVDLSTWTPDIRSTSEISHPGYPFRVKLEFQPGEFSRTPIQPYRMEIFVDSSGKWFWTVTRSNGFLHAYGTSHSAIQVDYADQKLIYIPGAISFRIAPRVEDNFGIQLLCGPMDNGNTGVVEIEIDEILKAARKFSLQSGWDGDKFNIEGDSYSLITTFFDFNDAKQISSMEMRRPDGSTLILELIRGQPNNSVPWHAHVTQIARNTNFKVVAYPKKQIEFDNFVLPLTAVDEDQRHIALRFRNDISWVMKANLTYTPSSLHPNTPIAFRKDRELIYELWSSGESIYQNLTACEKLLDSPDISTRIITSKLLGKNAKMNLDKARVINLFDKGIKDPTSAVRINILDAIVARYNAGLLTQEDVVRIARNGLASVNCVDEIQSYLRLLVALDILSDDLQQLLINNDDEINDISSIDNSSSGWWVDNAESIFEAVQDNLDHIR